MSMTLYRLFITRFHSPRQVAAKDGNGRKRTDIEKVIKYSRERLSMDLEFASPRMAREWVEKQKRGNKQTDPDYQWCELWGDPVPVSDAPACEKARMEFDHYTEQSLFGEEMETAIKTESEAAFYRRTHSCIH